MRTTLNVLMVIAIVLSLIRQEWVTFLWIFNSIVWMNRYYNAKEN